jgi:hypothetical protein
MAVFAFSVHRFNCYHQRKNDPQAHEARAMRRSSIMIITGRRAEGGNRLPVALLAERKPSRA